MSHRRATAAKKSGPQRPESLEHLGPQPFLRTHRSPTGLAQPLQALEISTLGEGRKTMQLTIDSGAAETVTNRQAAPEYEVMRPQGPERSTNYVLPDGNVIANEGEQHVKV